MPAYKSLKTFWDNVSADWTPIALANQPYLLPLHNDHAKNQPPSPETDSTVRGTLLRLSYDPAVSDSTVDGASSSLGRTGATAMSGRTEPTRRSTLGSISRLFSFARSDEVLPPSSSASTAQPSVSAVAAHALQPEHPNLSLPSASPIHLPAAQDFSSTPDSVNRSIFHQHTSRRASQTSVIQHTPNGDVTFKVLPATTNMNITSGTMPLRHSEITQNYGTTNGQSSGDRCSALKDSRETFQESKWQAHSDNKADNYAFHAHSSNPRLPLISQVSPSRPASCHGDSSSPDSPYSGDMVERLFSPKRRQERRQERKECHDREREDWWWSDEFDLWNLCLGVYLMGCIVVIALAAAVIAIWILLHQ